jgi:hypothetical protein
MTISRDRLPICQRRVIAGERDLLRLLVLVSSKEGILVSKDEDVTDAGKLHRKAFLDVSLRSTERVLKPLTPHTS